jgi:hypothetical protein
MTDSTNETVEAPKELSAVEQKQAEVDAKRAELARLSEENTVAAVDAEEAIQLAKLAQEEQRLEVELAYQRRLKAAREAQTVDNLVPTPAEPVVVPTEEPGAPIEAPTAPAVPVTDTNTAEATTAKATGKGK